MRKISVAVIYGGRTGEHPISCATAGAVMAAMDPEKYDIMSIGIRRDGTWVPGETDPDKLQLGDATAEVAPSPERIIICPGDGTQPILARNSETGHVRELGSVDVVFPLIHGPFGEDGTLQGLLEMAGLSYVGSGVFASAAGMDKVYMKQLLEHAGLAVGPYVYVSHARWKKHRQEVLDEISQLKFPLFVKPARAGSSLGMTKVNTMAEIDAAIANAAAIDPRVLVEQGINGREIECAVLGGLGGKRAMASGVGEVLLDVPEGEFYDFAHKYVATDVLTNQIPADVTADECQRLRDTALRTFEAFSCEGLTRVDMFLCPDGSVVVNELNTMPGFTPFSMYPALWQKEGLTYPQLVDHLIELALERPIGLR
ncbi:D-alanine--D-alanine ligase family protein [Arcanobacterium canis]